EAISPPSVLKPRQQAELGREPILLLLDVGHGAMGAAYADLPTGCDKVLIGTLSKLVICEAGYIPLGVPADELKMQSAGVFPRQRAGSSNIVHRQCSVFAELKQILHLSPKLLDNANSSSRFFAGSLSWGIPERR